MAIRLTDRELICLQYLSNKMEATALMVGENLAREGYGNRYAYGSGRVMMGNLKKKGFVMRLPDLKAWRLTKQGRELLIRHAINKEQP